MYVFICTYTLVHAIIIHLCRQYLYRETAGIYICKQQQSSNNILWYIYKHICNSYSSSVSISISISDSISSVDSDSDSNYSMYRCSCCSNEWVVVDLI